MKKLEVTHTWTKRPTLRDEVGDCVPWAQSGGAVEELGQHGEAHWLLSAHLSLDPVHHPHQLSHMHPHARVCACTHAVL